MQVKLGVLTHMGAIWAKNNQEGERDQPALLLHQRGGVRRSVDLTLAACVCLCVYLSLTFLFRTVANRHFPGTDHTLLLGVRFRGRHPIPGGLQAAAK